MTCGKRYIVVKTGINATCQREAGHKDGQCPTAHARLTIVGDRELGWGNFGEEPKAIPPYIMQEGR